MHPPAQITQTPPESFPFTRIMADRFEPSVPPKARPADRSRCFKVKPCPHGPASFQRLSGKLPTATAWVELVQDFGQLFATLAGHPQTIRATRSRISGFPHRMRSRVRELLPSSE